MDTNTQQNTRLTSDQCTCQLQADLDFLKTQHPELYEIAKHLAFIALNPQAVNQTPVITKLTKEPQNSLQNNNEVLFRLWYLYFLNLRNSTNQRSSTHSRSDEPIDNVIQSNCTSHNALPRDTCNQNDSGFVRLCPTLLNLASETSSNHSYKTGNNSSIFQSSNPPTASQCGFANNAVTADYTDQPQLFGTSEKKIGSACETKSDLTNGHVYECMHKKSFDFNDVAVGSTDTNPPNLNITINHQSLPVPNNQGYRNTERSVSTNVQSIEFVKQVVSHTEPISLPPNKLDETRFSQLVKLEEPNVPKQTDLNENMGPEERNPNLWLRNRRQCRENFVVRITRLFSRCVCHTPSLQNDSEKIKCPIGKKCQPQVYISFQARLPSLLTLNSCRRVDSFCSFAPLRLDFTCQLNGQGPSLSLLNSPKIADKVDVWEAAGAQPGLRIQVINALRNTVSLILQKLKTEGFDSMMLDSEYVFFPSLSELRPIFARQRQLSASSDSSVPYLHGNKTIDGISGVQIQHISRSEECKPQITTFCNNNVNNNKNMNTSWCNESNSGPFTWHHLNDHASTKIDQSGKYCIRNLSQPPMQQPTWDPNQRHTHNLFNSMNLIQPQTLTNADSANGTKFVPNNATVQLSRTCFNEKYSIPASPSRLDCRFKPIPEGTPMVVRTENSKCADRGSINCTNIVQRDDTSNIPNKQKEQLKTTLAEVAGCITANPGYPVVIMPTNPTTVSPADSLPLVFQVPHSDSVFVGMPPTPGKNPRVVTVSLNDPLIIIPHAKGHLSTVSGPKPGYVLVITPDNKYGYLPQGKVVK